MISTTLFIEKQLDNLYFFLIISEMQREAKRGHKFSTQSQTGQDFLHINTSKDRLHGPQQHKKSPILFKGAICPSSIIDVCHWQQNVKCSCILNESRVGEELRATSCSKRLPMGNRGYVSLLTRMTSPELPHQPPLSWIQQLWETLVQIDHTERWKTVMPQCLTLLALRSYYERKQKERIVLLIKGASLGVFSYWAFTKSCSF